MNKPNESQPANKKNRLGVAHVIRSVLAAAIGVQSDKNRQRDFNEKNSVYVYIAAGIIFTTLFVLSVATVVALVLR